MRWAVPGGGVANVQGKLLKGASLGPREWRGERKDALKMAGRGKKRSAGNQPSCHNATFVKFANSRVADPTTQRRKMTQLDWRTA